MNIFNAYWKDENDLNKKFNAQLNISFETNSFFGTYVQKTGLSWPKGRPDGIVFIDEIPRIVIEYKLYRTEHSSAIAKAACQECCYTYDKFGASIIPIRLHVIITESDILFIPFDKYEYLYDNFVLLREQYSNLSPSSFYKSVPAARELFKDVAELADFVIPMQNVDVDQVAALMCSMVA